MVTQDFLARAAVGTPITIQHLAISATAAYSIPIERGTVVRIVGGDEFLMKVVPELLFGGAMGSSAEGGVGDREANTVLLHLNIYDRPTTLFATDVEDANLVTVANGGIWDDSNQTTKRITLDKTQTDQSHVLEFALEDQTYVEIPLNTWYTKGGRGRQRPVRGGQTGCIFEFRSIESSASFGLDWALQAIEEDDNAVTYWNDTTAAWGATITWNALDDEVTLHTETLTFNTPTNDARLNLRLRSTDGAAATGNVSRIYAMSAYEPIVASQGSRAGTIGRPITFVMPYRGRLGIISDGDSTAYIEALL